MKHSKAQGDEQPRQHGQPGQPEQPGRPGQPRQPRQHGKASQDKASQGQRAQAAYSRRQPRQPQMPLSSDAHLPAARKKTGDSQTLSLDQQIQADAARRRRLWLRVMVIVTIAIAIAVSLALWFLVFGEGRAEPDELTLTQVNSNTTQAIAPTQEEIRRAQAIEAGVAADDPNIYYLPTPLIAEYGSLRLHSPFVASATTEIEFHQASYDTALQLTPLVTIVDAEEVAERHSTQHTSYELQPIGDEPLIAQAVSTWRLDSVGPELSSVDVGAVTGTVVYAPVSGTVVKIKSYSLFGLIDDYELHIQNPQHPELDIVMLHIDDLLVEVGDTVIGGCTRVAHVRNIGDVIDNNLSNFTMPPDPGNHCHVQVNDATRESYKGLEGALDIFNGKGYVKPEPEPKPEEESAPEEGVTAEE